MCSWEHAYEMMAAFRVPPCTAQYINCHVHWMLVPYWHQILGPRKEKPKS